ncbi:ThiF family adenylyltransferase [Rhodopseudomonas palustris]|nr:ThiF family adenylyltransferase [Rhodopseudomonas palustris]
MQRGFRRSFSGADIAYTGSLDETGLKVPVVVSLDDFEFITPPKIRLLNHDVKSRGHIPHVLRSDGTLCYLAPGTVVLDRYKPAQTIIQCLEIADRVIRDAVRGRLDGDIAVELAQYWTDGIVFVDLPPDFERDAKIHLVTFDREQTVERPLASTGDSPFLLLHERCTGKEPAPKFLCPVVRVPTLYFDPKQPWPPKTLKDLNDWLSVVAPAAVGQLEQAFARTSDDYRQWICLSAPNGRFFIMAEIPQAYRTPEILKNRRLRIGAFLKRISGLVSISAHAGVSIDEGYVFSRNLGGMNHLAGKRILLIGCGTIGGFLSQQLVQSGAGTGGGRLTIVDDDDLMGANLGRHLLGTPFLGRNKADACADFLKEQLPYADVRSVSHSITSDLDLIFRSDLVINATGEEALSIALNELAVAQRPNSPPLLFTWIEGNGAATVSFLCGDPERACYKCLKTDLARAPRYQLGRRDVSIEYGQVRSCADMHFIPYPVSRAAAAAGLACDMVLDWAAGTLTHTWRSQTLDHRLANRVKDCNPKKVESCPACGGNLE